MKASGPRHSALCLAAIGVIIVAGSASATAEPVDAPAASSEALIMRAPGRWIELGVPKEIDLGKEMRGSIWGAYVIGFRKRASTKQLTDGDIELFRMLLAPAAGKNDGVDQFCAVLLFQFAGSRQQSAALDLARKLLDHSNDQVRVHAAYALAAFGDKSSVEKILPLMAVRNEVLREIVKTSLKQLGYELPYEEPSPSPSPSITPENR